MTRRFMHVATLAISAINVLAGAPPARKNPRSRAKPKQPPASYPPPAPCPPVTQFAAKKPPRYALLLAGGLRSFIITWPLTLKSLIEPNGGRQAWWIALVAPHDKREQELADAALDLARRYQFDFVRVVREDENATRKFYEGEPAVLQYLPRDPVATFGITKTNTRMWNLWSFAFQWESVTRAHEALLASNESELTLIVRMRPDMLLIKPIDLAQVDATLNRERKSSLIPCKQTAPRFRGRPIDEIIVARPVAMAAYAQRWDGSEPAEPYVHKVVGRCALLRTITSFASLEHEFVADYVRDGLYKTAKTLVHDRCLRGAPIPPSPANYTGFNATDYALALRFNEQNKRVIWCDRPGTIFTKDTTHCEQVV